MADLQVQANLKILKNSKILVNVEEALQDILVVSYPFESKLFKGVLLDLTKRNLPFGILPPPGGSNEDEKLHTIVQRYTYFQAKPDTTPSVKPSIRRPIRPPARFRTVRLRPRQVLCSKCSSICNENSENVDFSHRKSRSAGNNSSSGVSASSSHSENTRTDAAKSPRSLLSDTSQLLNQGRTTLIPKLSRLQPNEITNALNGKTSPKEYWQSSVYLSPRHTIVSDPVTTVYPESSESSGDEESKTPRLMLNEDNESENGRVLRKKKCVGSMEDLWNESVFEEKLKTKPFAKHTPVIKISYGSQGEGTILKIPAKVSEGDVEESETEQSKLETKKQIEQDDGQTANAKAAKRALKKAKKAAKRKLANNSPSYDSAAAIGNYEDLYRRKHKHKMKHKKKHKEDRRLKEEDEGEHEEPTHNQWCDDSTHLEKSGCGGDRLLEMCHFDLARCEDETYSAIKERCLKQKLSISLKRLNSKAYAPTTTESSVQPIANCRLPDGRVFAVGDVVWGKLQGCPWWPGKVESLTLSSQMEMPQAHVSWYNSKTSSVIGCDQLNPFLKSFKSRFNKKKRGPYKEAIRQASLEAQRKDMPEPPTLVSLALSPPQVNVLS